MMNKHPAEVCKFCVLDEMGQVLRQPAMNQLQLSASALPGILSKMSINKSLDAIQGLTILVPDICEKNTLLYDHSDNADHVTIIQR